MRKKRSRTSESDDDSLDLSTLRDKKSKRVMSKLMAREIDAEAEADCAVGIQEPDEPKISSGKSSLREVDLERALYRWYERYQEQKKEIGENEDTVLETEQLLKKAKSFVMKLGGNQMLMEVITRNWVSRWQERYGVPKSSETEVLESDDTKLKKKKKRLEDNPEFRQALSIDTSWGSNFDPQKNLNLTTVFKKYAHDQIYIAFCFRLDWKQLPDKTLENNRDDPVWLLMAGNVTGRHRTRILVTGRHWRPTCLRHVNMLSQPVVYAGGGNGEVTADLLSWWFHREFIPAAEAINQRAVLVASDGFKLKPEDCLSSDGSVRLILVNENAIDLNLINAEFRTKYTTLLLRNLSHFDASSSIVESLNGITLKEAFPLFHKSWLGLRTESFQRCCASALDVPSSESISANLIHNALSSDLINLSVAKEEETKVPRLSLTRRSDVKTGHAQEDRMLLLELQWLAHDLGLEVTDEDLSKWALDSELDGVRVKPEPVEDGSSDREVPNAGEAVEFLSKALLWMETLPLEPNLLMVVRDIIDVAKQVFAFRLRRT